MAGKTKIRLIKLGRTLREGLRNFYRDGWLSFATVSVLTLSLSIIAMTFLLVSAGTFVLRNLQSNVSISAYFYPNVSETRITEIKNELKRIAEITDVRYVPQSEALKEFKETTQDPIIREALEMFEKDGENPLPNALVIKAQQPQHYRDIAKLLATPQYKDDIMEVNFAKNQDIIERLARLIALTRKAGAAVGALFVIIAILMVYNTVRITMFARRHEFEIMRLVGASNLYVRLPSLFEGIFYGVVAAAVTVALLALVTYGITPLLGNVLGGASLFALYVRALPDIAVLVFTSGVVLGMLSGMIAIRRYLRV